MENYADLNRHIMTKTCTQEKPGDKHAPEGRETKEVNFWGISSNSKKRKCYSAFHSFPESNNKHKEGEREQDPADAVHNDHLTKYKIQSGLLFDQIWAFELWVT